jgi:hypothetical protein
MKVTVNEHVLDEEWWNGLEGIFDRETFLNTVVARIEWFAAIYCWNLPEDREIDELMGSFCDESD